MAKWTRNSYKRKIILFAVFVFVSIALISTGFAAWVMSNDAETGATGNVSVGLVADSSLKIEITNKAELEAFKFQFEPAEGDNTGRVRLEKRTDAPYEQLKFTITGKITNPDILAEDGLKISMVLPAGIQEAIAKGYIVAPECADEAKVVTELDKTTGEFSYELVFKWGTAFGGINPSLYFDTVAEGLAVEDAQVKTTLEDLRAYVYGYYTALTADGAVRADVIAAHEADEMPKFTVTITAEAN